MKQEISSFVINDKTYGTVWHTWASAFFNAIRGFCFGARFIVSNM
jgi:hypothetical protein